MLPDLRSVGLPRGERESALLEHPAVLECAVIGCPDPDVLLEARTFVVPRAGQGASEALAAELQAFVRERLAPYERPRWGELRGGAAEHGDGKIQRFSAAGASGGEGA